jgi:hypothetical protein
MLISEQEFKKCRKFNKEEEIKKQEIELETQKANESEIVQDTLLHLK